MNSSAENHYEKDLKPPSPSSPPYQKDIEPPPPSSPPYQKDIKPPAPSSQPFGRTSATGYPVIDPPNAPSPLHIQSQPQVPWSTGLFDCCQDGGNCCLTFWCPCITFVKIADIVDRGSPLSSVSGHPALYSCFYRTKLRGQFHLHGNQSTDCLVHCFCLTCALSQEYRELKNRGFDMEIGWHANVSICDWRHEPLRH